TARATQMLAGEALRRVPAGTRRNASPANICVALAVGADVLKAALPDLRLTRKPPKKRVRFLPARSDLQITDRAVEMANGPGRSNRYRLYLQIAKKG
ncbi:MAG TPA: hypothetical protein VKR06_13980, partial [Ktedonosporobacter sp.]|nr:hypothetical protein [Ktedonosporobacter sp.]